MTTDLPDVSDPNAITPENLANNPNHWVHSIYHPDEVSYGMNLSVSSKSFWMGRLAMRVALGFPEYAILKDSYGRPQLAPGICGSISHKLDCGVALISERTSNNTTLAGVGVDIEVTSRPGKRSIAPRVLTKKEREELGRIPGITPDEEVLLRFR
jgi:4'-phosphopantetheinyl transferase EntD